MKIRRITARAGRTLPHPTRQFANVKADIELVADLEEGDDEKSSIRDLQVRCEQIVEQHSRDVCESIRRGEEIESTYQRVARLETELEREKAKAEKFDGYLFPVSQARHHDE